MSERCAAGLDEGLVCGYDGGREVSADHVLRVRRRVKLGERVGRDEVATLGQVCDRGGKGPPIGVPLTAGRAWRQRRSHRK